MQVNSPKFGAIYINENDLEKLRSSREFGYPHFPDTVLIQTIDLPSYTPHDHRDGMIRGTIRSTLRRATDNPQLYLGIVREEGKDWFILLTRADAVPGLPPSMDPKFYNPNHPEEKALIQLLKNEGLTPRRIGAYSLLHQYGDLTDDEFRKVAGNKAILVSDKIESGLSKTNKNASWLKKKMIIVLERLRSLWKRFSQSAFVNFFKRLFSRL